MVGEMVSITKDGGFYHKDFTKKKSKKKSNHVLVELNHSTQ